MEWYLIRTYRSQEIDICAWGWRRAWYVLHFRERLSTSLADVLRHSPFFWESHSKAQFSFQLSRWRLGGGKDWRVENKLSWVHHQNRMYCHPSLYVVSPIPQLCWGSSGASISMTVPTAPVIGGCSFYHVFLLWGLLPLLFLGFWMGWAAGSNRSSLVE